MMMKIIVEVLRVFLVNCSTTGASRNPLFDCVHNIMYGSSLINLVNLCTLNFWPQEMPCHCWISSRNGGSSFLSSCLTTGMSESQAPLTMLPGQRIGHPLLLPTSCFIEKCLIRGCIVYKRCARDRRLSDRPDASPFSTVNPSNSSDRPQSSQIL